MSGRPGQQQTISFAAAALAVAAGRTILLQNSSFACLQSLLITWVATATVGNRVPVVRIQGSPPGVGASIATIWQSVFGTITAGQTSLLALGAGVPGASAAAPLMQFLTLPVELTIPAGAQVQIFDNSNIDVNDTAALVANWAM